MSEISVPAFTIHAIEFENALGQAKAKEALEILGEAYPGYSWKVDVKGGICFIRLMDNQLKGPWGINMKMRTLDHDAAVFKRKVKFAAGEFLERANLVRGLARRGERIKHIDGLPKRFQPNE